MKRAAALIALAGLCVTPTLAQEAAMPTDAEISQILSDRIGRDQANVGIAVAVIENGETRVVSHGTLTKGGTDPVTEHTPFEAGSITKVFTSLVLAQLALEGQIDLGAPILDYLPEGSVLPTGADGRAITAFDLATHTSGLTGLPQPVLERGIDNPYSGYDDASLLSWVGEQELNRPIGETFEYSNIGVAVLGQAIEHVTGQDYADVLQERVLTPLGMNETSLSLTSDKPEGMATGHDATGAAVSYWDFDAVAPAGALITTSADLIKFIAAASGNTQTDLTPAFDSMLAEVRPIDESGSIGLGWFKTSLGQTEIVWHNGRTGGFASFAGFERGSGNGVVVLSNMSTDAGINDIGMHILDPSQPLREQPKLRTAVEIDPAILPGLVGEYALGSDVVLSVTAEANTLFAQLTGQERFEIFPESETEFFYRIVDAQISFTVENGVATGLVLHQNGANMPGVKAE